MIRFSENKMGSKISMTYSFRLVGFPPRKRHIRPTCEAYTDGRPSPSGIAAVHLYGQNCLVICKGMVGQVYICNCGDSLISVAVRCWLVSGLATSK